MKVRHCATFAAILGALGTLPAVPARAEFMSGNKLYRFCTQTDTEFDRFEQQLMCVAYIQGAHDGLEAGALHVTYAADLKDSYRIVCVPNGVEAGQLKEIVVEYLRSKPADRNLSAAVLVYAALAEAYPCRSA